MRENLAAAAMAAMIALSAGCVPQYPHGLTGTPKSSDLASALVAAYQANPVRFMQEHRGDTVRARGTVSRIGKEGTVVFQHTGSNLHCRFSNLKEVAGLDRRDRVTFEGTVEAVNSRSGYKGTAHLSGCSLLPQEEG